MKNEKIDSVIYAHGKAFEIGDNLAFVGLALLGIGVAIREFSTTLIYQGIDDDARNAIREMKKLMDGRIINKNK